MEFINLEGMFSGFDEMADFFDAAAVAEFHQFGRLMHRDFLLPLIAAHAAVEAGPLDCQEAPVTANPNSDGTSAPVADVSLPHGYCPAGVFLIIPGDEELSLNLCWHVL